MLLLALLSAGMTPPPTDIDTTMHLARNGAVSIDSRTRNIVIRVGSGDLLIVRGGSVDADGHTVDIDGDDPMRGGSGNLEVTLPSWARLEVSTVSGDVTFTGTPERTHAESVNGSIRVDNGQGLLDLESVAGAIVVNGFNGTQLSIDATNQNVSVTNATGDIKVENVNGTITLHGIHSSAVSAETVNGNVEYSGDFAAGGRYAFTTQNNNVTLLVPAGFSARVQVTTLNGALNTDIPAVTNGSDQRNRDPGDEQTITATYGSGAARISIDVFNGNAIVKRASARP
ncbi:MAG TPA: DUF4097 family beta strand repeat-containing protein [Gemmatimonadales bacterium]|jgi:DUF4097 and DUF4098 domain-containing protein YvlB